MLSNTDDKESISIVNETEDTKKANSFLKNNGTFDDLHTQISQKLESNGFVSRMVSKLEETMNNKLDSFDLQREGAFTEEKKKTLIPQLRMEIEGTPILEQLRDEIKDIIENSNSALKHTLDSKVEEAIKAAKDGTADAQEQERLAKKRKFEVPTQKIKSVHPFKKRKIEEFNAEQPKNIETQKASEPKDDTASPNIENDIVDKPFISSDTLLEEAPIPMKKMISVKMAQEEESKEVREDTPPKKSKLKTKKNQLSGSRSRSKSKTKPKSRSKSKSKLKSKRRLKRSKGRSRSKKKYSSSDSSDSEQDSTSSSGSYSYTSSSMSSSSSSYLSSSMSSSSTSSSRSPSPKRTKKKSSKSRSKSKSKSKSSKSKSKSKPKSSSKTKSKGKTKANAKRPGRPPKNRD